MNLIKSFISAAMFFITCQLSAQNVYEEGQIDINLGTGLNAPVSILRPSVPLNLAVDYAIRENLGPGDIGLGGLIAYSSSREDDANRGEVVSDNYSLAFRVTYHVEVYEGVDTYVGLNSGYTFQYSSFYRDDLKTTSFSGGSRSGLFIGIRYYFAEQFGVFAEMGYGLSIVNAGLSLKL